MNFAALVIYTRLLTADEFGRYALVVSTATLVHIIVFQWLVLVVGRFIPANFEATETVLGPVLMLYLILAGLVVIFGPLVVLLSADPAWIELALLAIAFVIAHAWHEVNLKIATAMLAPVRYAILSGTKVVVAICVGAGLAWQGWGDKAPVIGLIAGSLFAGFLVARQAWSRVRPHWPDAAVIREYSNYGLPLTITFVLIWVASSADRFMLAWLLDERATGVYAVGYDLAQHSLGLLMTIASTAATPLVFRRFEQDGVAAGQAQMELNGQLMFALALSGAAGLVAVGPLLVELFIGEGYRADAMAVFPWVAISAAVVGIKSLHFDISFHLTKQSKWLIISSGIAVVVNIILNLIFIPLYGVVGAAWAGLAAFSVAGVFSWNFGRRVFPIPAVMPMLWRGSVVAAAAYFGAEFVLSLSMNSLPKLILALSSGGALAAGAACAVNIAGLRRIVLSVVSKNSQ